MKPQITCRYVGPDAQRFEVTVRKGFATKTETIVLRGPCHDQVTDFCNRHGLDADAFLQELLRAAEEPVVSAS